MQNILCFRFQLRIVLMNLNHFDTIFECDLQESVTPAWHGLNKMTIE